MHIIFAAALIAQIHTGQDLLTACGENDSTVCDTFIHKAIVESKGSACIDLKSIPASDLRQFVVRSLVGPYVELTDSASALVDNIFTDACRRAH